MPSLLQELCLGRTTLEPAPTAENAVSGRVGPTGVSTPEEPKAGELRMFDGTEFVSVPTGDFLMGSTSE
ncbi:MAG: hypothetical protein F4Y47_03665 [Acidobacteriia bacterium]|nr:hypothetical protein [Terriglobia bacterium]MYG02050.1 hypothetical protein [Terriglobia bacterium]MYK08115.1 hypothetical protein [Terriglobia bacterium]